MANVGGVPLGQFNKLLPSEQTAVMQGVRPVTGPPVARAPMAHPVVGHPAVAVPHTIPAAPQAQPPAALQSQEQATAAAQLTHLDRIASLVSPHFAQLASSVDRSNPLAAWGALSHAFADAARAAGYQQPEQFVAHLHDQADYQAGHQAAQQLVSRMQTSTTQAG